MLSKRCPNDYICCKLITMAIIKFLARGNTSQKEIYIRLSAGRSINIKRKTGFTINGNLWKFEKATKGVNKGKPTEVGEPKQTDAISKRLKEHLNELSNFVNKEFNQATEKGISINSSWLENQISLHQNRDKKENKGKSDLLTFIDYYIKYLPNHIQSSGKRGVAVNTIRKFETLKNKIADFQKANHYNYTVKDIDPTFTKSFDSYLRELDYSDNYIGTLCINLKTACKFARKEGLKTSSKLDEIKAVKEDTDKIILSINELEKIQNTSFARKALDNARDWLIIGCYTGQRVSDLLSFTTDNIIAKSGIKLLEFTQKKTGKLVILPIKDEVQQILDKRGGQFPYQLSDVKFNIYIKEVAKISGLTQLIKGSKLNPETKRKEKGTYPKHELVTSHICRRSFATNYYGKIPTPLLMGATGHATEKKFLIYIGKSDTDQAYQLAEYWEKESLSKNKEPNLIVLRNAQ